MIWAWIAVTAVLSGTIAAFFVISCTVAKQSDEQTEKLWEQKFMDIYLDEGAILPTRAHSTDAGLDLYSKEEKTIHAHGSAAFDTGVHIKLPTNTYGKIESKSGLNVKYDVVSCGGVIDEPYRGSIVVKLYNLGEKDYTVKKGDKIAQLVVMECLYVTPIETKDWNNDTERGTDGFGSTGR